jgi:DNA mismatch endonuclease (patch repair protein)
MDNRNPPPTNENVSKSMRSNKGKGTKPELIVRQMLRELGYSGYRLNWKKAPGHPDIAYPGRKVAIFVNGCFWHHCPVCDLPLPKSHADFWREKIERNVQRDECKNRELADAGWTVITIWECEIKKKRDEITERLLDSLCGE